MFPLRFPLLALLAAPAFGGGEPERVQGAQLTIRERIVIRIPRMATTPAPIPVPTQWKEKGGDRCIAVEEIGGAQVSGRRALDLVMAGGRRIRAKLDMDCPALDYYLGFYLKPSADGKVCAGRDAIRSRSGAVCPIGQFKKLVPTKP